MSEATDFYGTEEAKDVAKFSSSERAEIIYRLQAIENTVANLSRVIEWWDACTPTDSDGMNVGMGNTVSAIARFCERFAATLDAIGGNPMLAAFLPPDMVQTPEGA